jgi:predicted RNA-binding protein with PIN domain
LIDAPNKVLLVDGFNVLRSSARYDHLIEEMPDHTHGVYNRAREALLGDVAGFAGSNYIPIVVFDGGGNIRSTGEKSDIGGVQVVFSAAGKSADSVIEQMAYDYESQGFEVLVVTSDVTVQWTVLKSARVTRLSAVGFGDEVARLIKDGRRAQEQSTTQKTTLGARLDPKTAAALSRLARGE